jgi:Ras-related protein Rab-5C
LKLHIWDTAGSEKVQSVAPLCYKDAHAAVVVYSVDDEPSFAKLNYWIEQLDKHSN